MKKLLAVLALGAIATLAGCHHNSKSNDNPITGGSDTPSATQQQPSDSKQHRCKDFFNSVDGAPQLVCSQTGDFTMHNEKNGCGNIDTGTGSVFVCHH